jgi:hypothetical protein
VAIASIASVFRAKYGIIRTGRGRNAREEYVGRVEPDPDAERLREEVRALKERIAVLERIATDGSTALDREIEALRERR